MTMGFEMAVNSLYNILSQGCGWKERVGEGDKKS